MQCHNHPRRWPEHRDDGAATEREGEAGTGQDAPELHLSHRHREALHTCVWGPELWIRGTRCTAGIRATSQGASGAQGGTEGWTWGAGPSMRGLGEGVETVKTDNSEQFCG